MQTVQIDCRNFSFLICDSDEVLFRRDREAPTSGRGLSFALSSSVVADASIQINVGRGGETTFLETAIGRYTYVLAGYQKLSAETVGDVLYQLASLAALHSDSLILHGAAVLRKDGAMILAGDAGSGKTRALLAMQARDQSVRALVDDRCIVGVQGNVPLLLNRDTHLAVRDVAGRKVNCEVPAVSVEGPVPITKILVSRHAHSRLSAYEWLWKSIASPLLGADFLLANDSGDIIGRPPHLQDSKIMAHAYELLRKLLTTCEVQTTIEFSGGGLDD